MKLVFDMDNTLADFDASGGLDKMYDCGFFRNLQPYANVTDTLATLAKAGFEMYILSACIDSPYCVQEKQEWIRQYLPFFKESNVILVPYGTNKAEAFQTLTGNSINLSTVLFDDYKVNLNAWAQAGGTAVKCGKIYKQDRAYRQVIEFTGIADVLATI